MPARKRKATRKSVKRSSGATVRRARKATRSAAKTARKAGKRARPAAKATARTLATGMKVASAVLDESADFVDSMAGSRRKRR